MKDFLNEKRVLLDSIVLLIATSALTQSREMSLVKTNIQEGIMFMGLMKGALGDTNPYPESHNPTSQVIEPRAEKATEPYGYDPSLTETGLVKQLRAVLQDIINDSEEEYGTAMLNIQDASDEALEASEEVYEKLMQNALKLEFAHEQFKVSITKAKLWLGMQLNFLREKKEYKQITG